ncbi:tetraspanin-18-like [Ruditapes philippinarum]|uniref:tetraspanin-18-like n=1 Tax=Ruditapes philippinarum TaxID=129788 RepID=UPI00295A8FD4|nr:tetraspanin-18-like [Ruditapes philippinarum]
MEGQKCSKYFLVLVNVFIFLAGGACFAAGLMFKLDSGFLENDVINLFNEIQYSNIPIGFMSDFFAYLMMVFGGLILCVAVLGMCGAWKTSKSCLWVFIVLVVFFLLVEGVLIGLWMSMRGRTDQWLKGQMLDLLKDYAGPDQTDKTSKGWNKLFIEARCCGVNDQFKDGGTNSDFTELPTTWTSGTDKVPATCCQGVDSDTVSDYVNSAACTNTPSNFYTEGCYDRVVSYINIYSLISIVACGVCILGEIMGITAACVLIDKARSSKVGDGHDRRLKPKPKDQATVGRTPRY